MLICSKGSSCIYGFLFLFSSLENNCLPWLSAWNTNTHASDLCPLCSDHCPYSTSLLPAAHNPIKIACHIVVPQTTNFKFFSLFWGTEPLPQSGIKLLMPLPPLSEHWGDKCELLCSIYMVMGIAPWGSCMCLMHVGMGALYQLGCSLVKLLNSGRFRDRLLEYWDTGSVG